jgi:phage-related baseplate assembly protein
MPQIGGEQARSSKRVQPVADFTLEQLTTPLTVDQVKASCYATMASLGVDTTNWKPGAVVRTLFAATAIAVAAGSQLTSRIARMGVVALSEGDWLTVMARNSRRVERITAGFASGTVRISNSGGGVFGFEPDELVVRNRITGKTYVNTAAVNVGAQQADVPVAVRAVEAGSGSSAAAGDITEFETGLPPDLTVTNLTALTGLDEESDVDLRERYDEQLGSLSACGPRDAYAFAAKSAKRADGSAIGVTRVRPIKDAGFGTVTIIVATPSGAVAGDVNDPATDLGAVARAIQTAAAPDAVRVVVLSATPVVLPITCSVTAYEGPLSSEIEAAIKAKLSALISVLPIGGHTEGSGVGKLFRSDLEHAIKSAFPEHIFHVSIASPGSDVVYVQASDVIQLGTVTPTITRVVP